MYKHFVKKVNTFYELYEIDLACSELNYLVQQFIPFYDFVTKLVSG